LFIALRAKREPSIWTKYYGIAAQHLNVAMLITLIRCLIDELLHNQ